MDSLGEPLTEYAKIDWPKPAVVGGVLRGQIVYMDRFGNAITNIENPAKSVLHARVVGKMECLIKKFYQEVPPQQPVAVLGSSGFLEIAVNCGSAEQCFALKLGDTVEVF